MNVKRLAPSANTGSKRPSSGEAAGLIARKPQEARELTIKNIMMGQR
ncbi:MAG: hypothetical protein ABF868_12200 [Sporolactobacillus sp.]